VLDTLYDSRRGRVKALEALRRTGVVISACAPAASLCEAKRAGAGRGREWRTVRVL